MNSQKQYEQNLTNQRRQLFKTVKDKCYGPQSKAEWEKSDKVLRRTYADDEGGCVDLVRRATAQGFRVPYYDGFVYRPWDGHITKEELLFRHSHHKNPNGPAIVDPYKDCLHNPSAPCRELIGALTRKCNENPAVHPECMRLTKQGLPRGGKKFTWNNPDALEMYYGEWKASEQELNTDPYFDCFHTDGVHESYCDTMVGHLTHKCTKNPDYHEECKRVITNPDNTAAKPTKKKQPAKKQPAKKQPAKKQQRSQNALKNQITSLQIPNVSVATFNAMYPANQYPYYNMSPARHDALRSMVKKEMIQRLKNKHRAGQ